LANIEKSWWIQWQTNHGNIRKKPPTLMTISEKTTNAYENIRKNKQHL